MLTRACGKIIQITTWICFFQDPELPGYVWTVWLNKDGLPMWKAHLLSFDDAIAPFPIKEMAGLKSVGTI